MAELHKVSVRLVLQAAEIPLGGNPTSLDRLKAFRVCSLIIQLADENDSQV